MHGSSPPVRAASAQPAEPGTSAYGCESVRRQVAAGSRVAVVGAGFLGK